jgi:hypothetical protein
MPNQMNRRKKFKLCFLHECTMCSPARCKLQGRICHQGCMQATTHRCVEVDATLPRLVVALLDPCGSLRPWIAPIVVVSSCSPIALMAGGSRYPRIKLGKEEDDTWVSCVSVWFLGFEGREIQSLLDHLIEF